MFNVPDAFRTVADAFSAVVRDHPGKECIRIPRRPERRYLPDGLSVTCNGDEPLTINAASEP